MTTNSVTGYGAFIEEAFIKPIRSVLIVDDDYPTFEEILTQSTTNTKPAKNWLSNPGRVLNVINRFRNSDPALLVDIHDGNSNKVDSGALASHLHQSDLLILDFQLKDDGALAIQIVQDILKNDHFNLIVVHTDSEITMPFGDILLSLLSPCENLDSAAIEEGESLLEKSEASSPGITKRVQNSISKQQYFVFRHPSISEKYRHDSPANSDFVAIVHDVDLKLDWDRRQTKCVFMWAISSVQKANLGKMNTGESQYVNWSNQALPGPLWIRTDRGFIAFANKSEDVDLIDELQKALLAWSPSPSRLLSAKLRAEIDDKGVIAEDKNLRNQHVYAKFYETVAAETDPDKRNWLINDQISRQIEHLTSETIESVSNYFRGIVALDSQNKLQANYGIDISSGPNKIDALKRFNSYISCKHQITGWHLEPGHVFLLGSDKWVCMSPACDLVPGQRSSGIFGQVGASRKPFFAVKLNFVSKSLNAKQINSNDYLFLFEEEANPQIQQYNFFSGENNSVTWNLFVALESGKLRQNNTFGVNSISENSETQPPVLAVGDWECKIVAHLRYEYALNLIQKFGSSFTRVGLGFLSN